MPQVSKQTLGMSNFFGDGGSPAEEHVGDEAVEARSGGGAASAAYFSSQKSVEEAVEGFLQALVSSE